MKCGETHALSRPNTLESIATFESDSSLNKTTRFLNASDLAIWLLKTTIGRACHNFELDNGNVGHQANEHDQTAMAAKILMLTDEQLSQARYKVCGG